MKSAATRSRSRRVRPTIAAAPWPRRRLRKAVGTFAALAAFVAAGASCGYRPLYGASSEERFHVKLVRTLVPDAVASDEVVAGVRDELARGALLAPGEGFPRVEVEVLSEGEESRGIASVTGEPVARATAVGLSARAWIARTAGATPEDDTGDMRAEEVLAVDEVNGIRDPKASAFHAADGLRAAARRLGRKLGQRLMGLPTASEEH
jgi:hypothetical protein